MGLFLGLSGVVGSTGAEVAAALRDFSGEYSGYFRPSTASENDDTRLVIAHGPAGDTISYPGAFLGWDDASKFFSLRLRRPTFSFHIHDGDLWMFQLYVEGQVVTAFNPIPDYWGDISQKEEELMRGNPAIVAQYVPHLVTHAIERYLVRWDLDADVQEKAYPDDEFARGVDWQLVDFMKKLGFRYPFDDKGQPVGECFAFHADTNSEA